MEQHIISKKRFGLDATTIKMIALVLMVLDHIHQMYASQGAPIWLKMMGRPVFPLFLFIAAESFHYTRNRKKYFAKTSFSEFIHVSCHEFAKFYSSKPEYRFNE